MITIELFMTKMEELQINFSHELTKKYLDFYFKKLNEKMNDTSFVRAIDALVDGEVKFYKSAVNPIPNVTEILNAGRSKINRADYLESDEVKTFLRKQILEFRSIFWNREPKKREIWDKISPELKSWIERGIGKESFLSLAENGSELYHRYSEQKTEDAYFGIVKYELMKKFDAENGIGIDSGKNNNIGLDGMKGLLQ